MLSSRLRDYWIFLLDLLTGSRLEAEQIASNQREERLSVYMDFTRPLRILDLANGRLRPQYEILVRQGHCVVGLDMANRRRGDWTDLAYRFARWSYRRRLLSPPATGGSGLLCGDAARIPTSGNAFDLVTSIAAFEHFLDAPGVVREMHRVLRPDGIVYCGIHPFTCLSGGHNVQLMGLPIEQMPEGVEPWDHLRERRLPFHVPLNEWRIRQYVDEFSRHFEVLENRCFGWEGADLLTAEIEMEVASYSLEELTCVFYMIIGRKREK